MAALSLLGCGGGGDTETSTSGAGGSGDGGSSSVATSASGTSTTGSSGGGGAAAECKTAGDCDDGDACTSDTCDGGTCANEAIDPSDEDACTVDACDVVSGVTHVPVDPDDGDVCTIDACDPQTGVANTPVDPDDGDVCTIDACDPEKGISNTPVDPDDGDLCTIDACDKVVGITNHPVDPDDGDLCTVDTCDPLTGIANQAIDPDDGDACTVDACDAVTGVSHTAVNIDDGDACSVDACDAVTGVSHTPVNIDDGDVCTVDACLPATGVTNTPVNINDFDVCTVDSCDPVTGVAHAPINVDDGDGCTIDICDPATGVLHLPAVIDDGDACTFDACDPATGTITHQTSIPLFQEDFADNSQGWILGPEWAIGPAVGSTGSFPGADPDFDHTSVTSDNGVAGVVIGGNADGSALHGFYYLESPTFDGTISSGDLVLSFFRWLNSDYAPFMDNTVDVWDGAQWQNLWTSAAYPPVEDAPPYGGGWMKIEHNLTPYQNAAMKVRFGFDIGHAAVLDTVPGWTLDDVSIENRTYPSDDNPCTVDTCVPGVGPSYPPLDIDDDNACTTDVCDPAGSVIHTFTGYAAMSSDFSSLGSGTSLWTLDTEWEIAPAMASSGQATGNGDPDLDHTPNSNNNGVAGVVIGGNASTAVHDDYYLTSPIFNASVAAYPNVYLDFYRWLNSDWAPFVYNTVDVWNGSAWTNVWTSGGAPGISDASWQHIQHDITAYKGTAMRIRFGFEVAASGSFVSSQWNIDDVAVYVCQ